MSVGFPKGNKFPLSLILRKHSHWQSFGVGIFFGIASTVISQVFWLENIGSPGHNFFLLAAVIFSALFGGFWPGIVSMVISAIGAAYYLPPSNSFAIASPRDRVWLVLFVLVALILCWVGALLKDALQIADATSDELKEAIRDRDTFISVCSHELKTPLTSLKLQSAIMQMLMKSGGTELNFSSEMQNLRKLVNRNERDVDRLGRLIDDMLDVSRIRSGHLTIRPEDVNLTELVKEVVERFSLHPDNANIKVRVEKSDEVSGHWDRYRIEQVVANLISNALKYGKGNPIEVTVCQEERNACLYVEDHGMGIRTEDQEKIFQRFERVGDTGGISGLGLGLYIVKEIVNSHGGTIRVESKVEQGSTFIVELPRRVNALSRVS